MEAQLESDDQSDDADDKKDKDDGPKSMMPSGEAAGMSN